MNCHRLLVTKQNKKLRCFWGELVWKITTTATFIEALIPKNCFELEPMIHFLQKCSNPNCTLLLSDDLDDGEPQQTCCVAVLLSSRYYLFIYLIIYCCSCLLVWCGIFCFFGYMRICMSAFVNEYPKKKEMNEWIIYDMTFAGLTFDSPQADVMWRSFLLPAGWGPNLIVCLSTLNATLGHKTPQDDCSNGSGSGF